MYNTYYTSSKYAYSVTSSKNEQTYEEVHDDINDNSNMLADAELAATASVVASVLFAHFSFPTTLGSDK